MKMVATIQFLLEIEAIEHGRVGERLAEEGLARQLDCVLADLRNLWMVREPKILRSYIVTSEDEDADKKLKEELAQVHHDIEVHEEALRILVKYGFGFINMNTPLGGEPK